VTFSREETLHISSTLLDLDAGVSSTHRSMERLHDDDVCYCTATLVQNFTELEDTLVSLYTRAFACTSTKKKTNRR